MSKNLNPKMASAHLDHLLNLTMTALRFHLHYSFNLTVPASWSIDERVLDEIHILYVKGGCVTYVIEGQPVMLTTGSLLFLSDGTVHSAYQDLSEPLSIVPIRFKLSLYGDKPQHIPTLNPYYFSFHPKDPQKFRTWFETIHRYNGLPPSVRKDVLCHASLSQALAEMSRELEELEQNQPLHHAILQIKHAIETNPTDRRTVRELAAYAGLSSKYASQLFRQWVGFTIKEYQIKTRLEYARFLLEHSDQSVKEVSSLLGYPDPFVFSKQYKAFTGMAPSHASGKGRAGGGSAKAGT